MSAARCIRTGLPPILDTPGHSTAFSPDLFVWASAAHIVWNSSSPTLPESIAAVEMSSWLIQHSGNRRTTYPGEAQ